MRLFNLRSDPKEDIGHQGRQSVGDGVMDKIVADFNATTERYPHVPHNAPDPYVPPKRSQKSSWTSREIFLECAGLTALLICFCRSIQIQSGVKPPHSKFVKR